MKKHKYTALFIITVLSALVINFLIRYSGTNSDYFIVNDSISVSGKNLKIADRYLSSLQYEEYPKAIIDLENKYEELVEYRDALAVLNGQKRGITKAQAEEIIGTKNLTDGQAAARQEQIKFCLYRLEYAAGFPDYVDTVKNNADAITGVSIFPEKTRKNALRAGNDFYGLENIRVSAVSDIGVNILFSDSVTDILAVISALICAAVYTARCRSSANSNMLVKSRFLFFAFIYGSGLTALYAENIFITDRTAGLGDLNRAVQSVTEFQSCPYLISIAALISLRTLIKTAACLFIYFIGTAAAASENKKISVSITLFLISAEIILIAGNAKIHFLTMFAPQNIIGKYSNTSLMGETVGTAVLLAIMSAFLVAAAFIWAYKTTSAMLIFSKEQAERRYYDEINEKYNESRLIRHDIKNHLTAVAMLLDEGKIPDARKYLSEISAEMDSIRPPVKTGSAVLDALLFSKCETMRKNGITASVSFEVSFEDTDISEYDLCGIFGNILDNSAEACIGLPESDRIISLSVKRRMDMICIFCENKYTAVNSDYATTKADKSAHGMGLVRVKKIAEKYGGTTDISAENGCFSISVLLNISKK